MVIQRTGAQGRGTVTFIQNNFYYDAFFLKAIGALNLFVCCMYANGREQVLNGACDNGWCTTSNGSNYLVSVVPLLLRLSQR